MPRSVAGGMALPSHIRPGQMRQRRYRGYSDEEDELENADSIITEDDEFDQEGQRELQALTKNLRRENRPKLNPKNQIEEDEDGSFDYEAAERRRKAKQNKKKKPIRKRDRPDTVAAYIDAEASESDDGEEEDGLSGDEEASEGEFEDSEEEDEGSFSESEEKPTSKPLRRPERPVQPSKTGKPSGTAAAPLKKRLKQTTGVKPSVQLKGDGDEELVLNAGDEDDEAVVPKKRKRMALDDDEMDEEPASAKPTAKTADPRIKPQSAEDDDEFLNSDEDN